MRRSNPVFLAALDCFAESVIGRAYPERVLAETADQRGRRPEFCRRYRLVGALAAGEVMHRGSRDGFADARIAACRRHHIHVDAAGDEYAPHDCPQNA